MDAFAEMLNYDLTVEEIETYALSILEEEGFDQEDYNNIRFKLILFKENYCALKTT
jgi:hypothetical protein